MPTQLQSRAQELAEQFATNARKPVVIEFAGVPKAGKTSTISQVQMFLKRCGFRVEVVIERASVCPIRDKRHSNFNVWTACTTLANILEQTQDPPRNEDPQILILDRGLFDSICWLTMMERLSRLRSAEREALERYLTQADWRDRLNAVVLMKTSPEDAMKRGRGYLPVEAAGSIMNYEVLGQMLATTRETANRLKDQFRIFEVDTSSDNLKNNPEGTAQNVANIVLDLVEEHLQEDILSLPKTATKTMFGEKTIMAKDETEALVRMFNEQGSYRHRKDVEADKDAVQALPVVVVRNKNGDVLRLKRRERSETNSLHQKFVIWAGGHVRKEDARSGNAIIAGVLRELQEELRLSLEPGDLHLLGALYDTSGERTAKHAAIVYEWRAKTDDVAVVLSSAEFFERRGTSVSGTFISLNELVNEINTGEVKEPWSTEIAKALLPSEEATFIPNLFS